MTGNNPAHICKLGTKRHILTDKEGIPLSVVISAANTHDVKLVTGVVDNAVADLFHPLKQRKEEKENNIYALLKHIVQT